MIEIKGDFWMIQADWKCIPTNGSLRKNGEAIFGKGLAKQARDRFDDIEIIAGQSQQRLGNVFRFLCLCGDSGLISGNSYSYKLFAFPTKDKWNDCSSLSLIRKSIVQMTEVLESCEETPNSILLPRVGCGEGHRGWENEVKPLLTKFLPEELSELIMVCYL